MKQSGIDNIFKIMDRRIFMVNLAYLIMLILILSDFIKIQLADKKITTGNLYIGTINYTIPAVKNITSEKNNISSVDFDINSFFCKLAFAGLNFKNTELILKKELPGLSFKTEEVSNTKADKIPTNIVSFELGSNSVVAASSDQNIPVVNSKPGASVYNPDLKNKFNSSVPQVLIYHTHTCESYAPGPDNTLDQTKNVCAAGDTLSDCLNQYYGINVIHDKTIHDENSYLQAYKKSGETVAKYMKKYGNFDMVIDMHRDSINDRKEVTVNMNGENVSTFRFVIARGNPHVSKNLNVVNQLIKISDKLFPNYCKDIFYYNTGTNYFNQAKSDNAFLLELGSYVSTTEEAKASGKYMARIIAEYLNSKK